MTALAHLRDLHAATRVLQDMRSAGEHPDAVAYNALLHVCACACAKAGDGHKALDLLDEMHQYSIPADVKAYNTVLKACVNSGMIEKALDIFARMMHNKVSGDRSLSPTRETLTIVMQYYSTRGDVEAVRSLLETMEDMHGISADARCYMVLLEAHARASAAQPLAVRTIHNEAALACLHKAMARLGPSLTRVEKERLVTKTLEAVAQSRNVQAAAGVYEMYGKYDVLPSPQAFAALINLHYELADGPGALRSLQAMIAQGISPSPNFFGRTAMAMLLLSCSARRRRTALRCTTSMSGRGVILC